MISDQIGPKIAPDLFVRNNIRDLGVSGPIGLNFKVAFLFVELDFCGGHHFSGSFTIFIQRDLKDPKGIIGVLRPSTEFGN